MALADKLRALADADPDTDVLAFLGVGPAGLRWDGETLTVGAETVSMDEARAALRVPPRRAVEIKDLC